MRLNDCWECGRPAPSGVCAGPHPGYSLSSVARARNVTATAPMRVERGVRRAQGPRGGLTPCPMCGVLKPAEQMTCSNRCRGHMVRRGQPAQPPRRACVVCEAEFAARRITCSSDCELAYRRAHARPRVLIAAPKVVPKRQFCPDCGFRLSEDDAYTWCDRCAWEPGDSNAAPTTNAARAAS